MEKLHKVHDLLLLFRWKHSHFVEKSWMMLIAVSIFFGEKQTVIFLCYPKSISLTIVTIILIPLPSCHYCISCHDRATYFFLAGGFFR